MNLLITAPIRIDFLLNSGETAFKTDAFFEFWKSMEKKDFTDSLIDKINYYKTQKVQNINKSYDDKSRTDTKILGIVLNKIASKTLDSNKSHKFIGKYFDSIIKSEINVYDNTIGIFDFRIKLKDIKVIDNEEFTTHCETQAKFLLTQVIEIARLSIHSYLNFLHLNDKSNILQKQNNEKEYNDFVDFFREKKDLEIMWASCALKYHQTDSNIELLDNWLKSSIEQDSIEAIKNSTSGYSLDWLKYAFREEVEEEEQLWETMFLAQYYYSVIEVIIYNLKLIINESFRINDKKSFISNFFGKNKIITINKKFEEISSRAYLHITDYKDTKKYLKREQLKIFNTILEAWTFEDLIVNTQELLLTVKERVEIIYNKLAVKNNFYTDILLTSIGFFAIVDLVLSFSQYSREYASNAMINSREEGESFLYTLSNIPIDTFIGSGFTFSVILLLLYFVYRKKILP